MGRCNIIAGQDQAVFMVMFQAAGAKCDGKFWQTTTEHAL